MLSGDNARRVGAYCIRSKQPLRVEVWHYRDVPVQATRVLHRRGGNSPVMVIGKARQANQRISKLRRKSLREENHSLFSAAAFLMPNSCLASLSLWH
jgi:hypothetical protein